MRVCVCVCMRSYVRVCVHVHACACVSKVEFISVCMDVAQQSLEPSSYPVLLQQSLETDVFSEIISILQQELRK